jgi:hypothetical protein
MKFQFDPRNLPDNLQARDAQDAFCTTVLQLMENSAAGVAKDDALFAAVVGMLVLDGFTDPSSASFDNGFWGIRGESAASTTMGDGVTDVPNKHVYQDVAAAIGKFTGHRGTVFFQELADVSRHLLQNTGEVPVDSPSFFSQIRVFDDAYVQNGAQGDSLDLPDLSGAQGSAAPDDLRPDNIRAVGVILAAYNLEQLRLFDAVDRIIETWWNGQLPVGSDKGSKALDDFYWSSEFRLSPTARHMQYGRVLGITGGEVSTEVQPNTQFNDLWMRLIASLAEYDRQQRIGDLVGGQRTSALTLTGEQVRQAGRNLAANASLYGWGGTQFAGRRLAKHVQSAFDILNTPEIQSAYGVDGPYKVIERVSPEIGGTPNIVKYRTLADSGKKILDLVAKYTSIWSGGTGNPLFSDAGQTNVVNTIAQGLGAIGQLIAGQNAAVVGANANVPGAAPPPSVVSGTPDVSATDQDSFMRQAGYVIAVMGIKDDQVEQFSQPAETQYAPSIPSLAPMSGGASTNGSDGIDQLRQMVAQGQVPSADQLKALVLPTH